MDVLAMAETQPNGVGGRSGCIEGFSWEGLEQSLVQILVVVATIPMRTWKTEVEQVFMRTALGHESPDPNSKGERGYG